MIKTFNINCTGCGACYSKCPAKAITMVENQEGFLEPLVDKAKCTNCGLCSKICPVLNPVYRNNNSPACYAVMASDDIRQESSSGGVFPLLAYHFLEQGGFVAGAVWDSPWSVKHIISDKKADIELMRGSKYLQSTMGNCYKETKDILEAGRSVLFTGTPCQIAGLNAFLQKDYENLYTVEIVCHGTPSPKVFKKYLEENFDLNMIENYNFRPKTHRGWGCGVLLDVKVNNKSKLIEGYKDCYNLAFHAGLIARNSCGECKFNKLPRQANITIGDFWGIDKVNKKYNDKKGISVVLINNLKGEILLNILNSSSKFLKKVPIKSAIRSNPNIIKPNKNHRQRELFYQNIDKVSINENVGRILNDNCDCMLINLWSTCNYGASLTCLGVKFLLEKLNMQTKVLNYVPELGRGYKNSFSEKFAQKYLNLTKPIRSYEDFLELNKVCKTFIAGSDQIFNSLVMHTHNNDATSYIYLLDFVQKENKKISYAASFGESEFKGNEEDKFLFNHFVKQFDFLSIREDAGIDILRENFGITDAVQLIDGAFHIPRALLDDMTKDYKFKGKYIACYVLPYYQKKKWYRKYLKTISQKLGCPIREMKFSTKTPVEEWLAYIKNAEFVISDSFHAIVFSIIFNKRFIQVKNATQSRFESLFRVLGIENNSIGEFDCLDDKKIFANLDWESINSKIKEEVLKAEKWMQNALGAPKRNFCINEFENFVLINQQLDRQKNKQHINYVKNKNSYLFTYYFYKMYKNFCFGEKRKIVKDSLKKYKNIKTIINNL